MPAKTINEVIAQLDTIVANSEKNKSPLGYFAVLYRMVTIRVRDGILAGEFEDNARMERLDVLFANRYLDAYQCLESKKKTTQSWSLAFEKAKKNDGLILQHLLLGINAHINLDLGIAASETVGSNSLEPLKGDFNGINAILSEMVDDVQNRIGKVSPLFRLLDPLTGAMDEKLVNFSIGIARDGAWEFAQSYHKSSDKATALAVRDDSIAKLADALANPKSRWLNTVLKVIRLFESKNAAKVILTLQKP
jgi:hypothetical protein